MMNPNTTPTERQRSERELPRALEVAVLPLDMVAFPDAIRLFTIVSHRPLPAMAMVAEGDLVGLVAQRHPTTEAPGLADVHEIGVLARVIRPIGPPRGDRAVVVEGLARVRFVEELGRAPALRAWVQRVDEIPPATTDVTIARLVEGVRDLAAQIIGTSPFLPNDLIDVLVRQDTPWGVADFVSAVLPSLTRGTRQELLETLDVATRVRRIHEELVREIAHMKTRVRIQKDVEQRIGQAEHKAFLRDEIAAMRRELGEADGAEEIVERLKVQLEGAGLAESIRVEAFRELERLRVLSPESPESGVVRNYLECLAGLPWAKTTSGEVDLGEAARVLDEDHADLDKVKERVLEHLAVYKLRHDLRAPILCLVGPPGVGKTSIGRSIARACGRPFVRVSLGGMHDEAEIRGHRRTYVGAMPGQIMQGIRRAGSRDPVFMLDEIDKLGKDFRGDPAAALMEVLDPEQNVAFRDLYLDVPFDLSRVLFLTTANVADGILPALRDRLELLDLPGYSDDEKLEIAEDYLVGRQVREHGLDTTSSITFTSKGLEEIIRLYTREAGVRQLERAIGSVCRKRAREVSLGATGPLVVTPDVVRSRLGVPPHRIESDLEERTREPGVAVALAWTPEGGDVLFVEAARMPRGKGGVTMTGHLGEVMQESAKAALTWVRAHAGRYGIETEAFRAADLHLHVPSGSVHKDGPSAGLVMVAALVSLFTARPIRPYVAMSGEITLSGHVLGVGGIKEKVLAAKRNGIREIVLPAQNAPTADELPAALLADITIRFVTTVEEALAHVLPSDTPAARATLPS